MGDERRLAWSGKEDTMEWVRRVEWGVIVSNPATCCQVFDRIMIVDLLLFVTMVIAHLNSDDVDYCG